MLSWTGRHGNMTFNQTLHYLYRMDMDDIEFQELRDFEFQKLGRNITTRFTIANQFCKVLEIYPSMMGTIGIWLKGNESYTVIVNDPGSSNDLLFSQTSGDQIPYDTKEGNKTFTFLVNLKEIDDETGGNGCTTYPTKQYQSFLQCFKDSILKKTKPVLGFDLPFFLENNNQTIKPTQMFEKHRPTIKWLQELALTSLGGRIYKPDSCLPPCIILTATPKQQQKFDNSDRFIFIFFNEVVQVQNTVLAYDIGSLLVELGSSLGLWLGLSVVGVFDLLTACLGKLAKSILRG